MSQGRVPAVQGRTGVLLAAGGEGWEAGAMTALGDAGYAVVKRCVDLHDLLASASTGQAHLAVLSGRLVGLDADAVATLGRDGVRAVAVGGDADVLLRLGLAAVVDPGAVADLPAALDEVVAEHPSSAVPERPDLQVPLDPVGPEAAPEHRLVAVHGGAGAPGRTTLAVGLAAHRAAVSGRAVLVDADPWGGTVAQHLGVLDEVSGLLAGARLANAGELDAAGFARCRRTVSPGLDVVTGLPRPDRWIEVRPGALEQLLERAREVGEVVVDTGFSLEDDADLGRPLARNQLTLDALALADEVVVVGSADPPGLARLARTLVELRDATPAPLRVVVNRMRESLGWDRRDITGMVEGYCRPLAVHFVPDDTAVTDRALVSGRSLVELGDSALRRAVGEVADAAFAVPAQAFISR